MRGQGKGIGRKGRLDREWSRSVGERLGEWLLGLEQAGVERRQAFLLLWRLLLIRQVACREASSPLAEVWQKMEGLTKEVGHGISSQVMALESDWQELLGDSPVFCWSDFEDSLLRRLILELSLGFEGLENEEMGRVLRQLIEKFWVRSEELGQGWLPESLVNLMVGLLGPLSEGTVYEPMGPMGQCLLGLVRQSGSLNGCLGLLPDWALLARLFLQLQGLDEIRCLSSDQLPDGPLAGVIGVLPLLQEDWRRATENQGEQTEALVSLGESVSRYLALLRPGGQAVLVVPPGVLFREWDVQYRRDWVEQGLLVAVIMLPSKVFFHTPMAAALLVFERPKGSISEKDILFIDAEAAGLSLEKSSHQTLLTLMEQTQNQPGVAAWVSREMVEKESYTLSVTRYLSEGDKTLDWPQAWQSEWQRLKVWEQQKTEALDEMRACWERLGLVLPIED